MTDYSLGDVARILKVSPRRLRYWQKTQLFDAPASHSRSAASEHDRLGDAGAPSECDLVEASAPTDFEHDPCANQAQDGREEGYAFRDLVVLRAIVSLIDKGIPLQSIRRNLETLRDRLPELDDPAAALRLWDEASHRLVVRHDGRLEEASGQLLLEFETDAPVTTETVASLSDFEAESRLSDRPVGDAIEWFERGCELDAEPSGWSEAIEAYETALELEPDYADAYCNLGAVRYNQGKRAEARRAFEACLSREADHVEANFNLANVLEEEGDDRGALAHYRRALAADPLYPDLHINLALLYEKLGRDKPAREHWRRYLRLDVQGSWAEVARLRLDPESDRVGSE